MRVRFIVEKGNKGYDDTEVRLAGIRSLPKFLLITGADFETPLATAKAFLSGNVLMVEADLREQEFQHYPTIGFESIVEVVRDGITEILESELHTVSLQPTPNNDPEILTIEQQLADGSAAIMDD